MDIIEGLKTYLDNTSNEQFKKDIALLDKYNNATPNTEAFLRLVYGELKLQFSDYSKTHWIWVDYFKDEESGFNYFKDQFENDKDCSYTKDIDYYLGYESLDDLAFDIASDIASKMRECDFIRQCEQTMIGVIL